MNFLEKLIAWMENRPRVIWSITIMYALLIFYLSSIPITQPQALKIPYITTIEHVIEYAILGFLLLTAFRSIKRNEVWAVIALACLYGVSDEIHQSFTPGRFCDVFDVLADCAGVLIGVFTGRYKRVE